MSSNKTLLKDVFVIPLDEKKYMVYVPFSKVVFTTDKESLPKIARMYNALLKESKVKPRVHKKRSFAGDKYVGGNAITLCITTDCNLRCVYCYASGGERKSYMDWKVAKAAMDLSLSRSHRSRPFSLGFHGGGEPFMSFEMMKKCVDYARGRCEKKKMKFRANVATNGVLTDDELGWALKNNIRLNISFDGIPEIQDKQRPMPGNEPSHSFVEKTVRRLVSEKADFGVRSTITKESVEKMEEILKYFHGLGIKYVHFEPAFECGRCLTTKTTGPEPMEFVNNYTKALETAEKLGISLYYSGSAIDKLSNTFCGAAGKNFFVTADGFITACLEVQHKDDPASKVFFYGKFEKKSGKFRIYKNKLAALSSRTVGRIKACQNCFCKFHCAGDCLVKNWRESGSLFKIGEKRCVTNKELTKYVLLRYLQGNPIKMRDFESGKKLDIV